MLGTSASLLVLVAVTPWRVADVNVRRRLGHLLRAGHFRSIMILLHAYAISAHSLQMTAGLDSAGIEIRLCPIKLMQRCMYDNSFLKSSKQVSFTERRGPARRILLDVNRCQEVTNFLIPSAGNYIVP